MLEIFKFITLFFVQGFLRILQIWKELFSLFASYICIYFTFLTIYFYVQAVKLFIMPSIAY